MNKVLVITGGSKGIGLATIELFLSKDYRVINISRSECKLTHENFLDLNLDLNALQASDLESSLSNSEITLVHNAAVLEKDTIINLQSNSMRNVLETNLIAPIRLNQMVLPFMKEGSSIIYIGSTLSEIAVPGAASYIISKHALAGLMKSTCQDLVGRKIHTALVCPGFTDTEMLRKHLNHDEEILNDIGKNNAFGRLIQPTEMAELILQVANAPILNGSVIHGNLGQLQN